MHQNHVGFLDRNAHRYPVKSGTKIISVGGAMVVIGLILFYSIQTRPDIEPALRMLKHSGTFIGLMGIGVSIAGGLLYLVNYGQPAVSENSDL